MERTRSKKTKLQSKRTSTTSLTSKLNNTRNIATQTTDLDSFIEIASLQEKLKLLQLENDILRRHMYTSHDYNNATYSTSDHTPQTTSKINIKRHICHCKGNCASKACGCVKKNNKCSSLCKCNDKTCKNQELKDQQENKENVNENDMETSKKQKRRKDNKIVETTKNYSAENDKINDVIFDPMKPRHQLSRTPPSSKKFIDENTSKADNTIQSQSCYESPEQITKAITASCIKDIEEEKIDWEQHTAQLIPCKKCKRTFMPHRIQKHENCCKKL